MVENPIAISQKIEDADALTINLSRRTFSDFIFSLVQTPSEETRKHTTGFELTKGSIKVLIDKLSYYIKTNNDLVREEFTAKVDISSTAARTIYSKEHFFNVDDADQLFVPSISITLSYLIAFKRTDEEKSLEKQVVSIRFIADRPGRVEVSIRSTEFTWPSGIFNVVSNHLQELADEVEASNPAKATWLSGPAKFIARNPYIADNGRVIGIVTMVVLFFAVLVFLADEKPNAVGYRPLFDPVSQSFENVSIEQLVDEVGWRDAAELLADSNEIFSTGLYDRPLAERRSLWQAVTSFSPTFLLSSLVFLVSLILVFREARRVGDNSVGRVVMKSNIRTSRSTISPTTGVVESLFYGVIGGVFVLLLEVLLL